MKRFLLPFWIYGALFLLSGPMGCSVFQLKSPKIELQSVQVKSVSFKSMSLLVNLQLDNPNNKDVHIDMVSYVLEFNGQKFNEDTLKGPWNFPKNAKTEVSLPIHVKIGSIIESLQILKNGENLVKITGTAIINNMRVPFKGEKKLKVDL